MRRYSVAQSVDGSRRRPEGRGGRIIRGKRWKRERSRVRIVSASLARHFKRTAAGGLRPVKRLKLLALLLD